MIPHDPEKLERLIHQTLRSLPDRRAPHTLEARVLAAVAARAELPWWRQSFAAWPVAARTLFVTLSVAVAAVIVLLLTSGSGQLSSGPILARLASPLGEVRSIFDGLVDLGGVVFRAIPSWWIYGGIAIVATLYTALFGLGAAAYRTLYVQR